MLNYDEALERILADLQPLAPIEIPLLVARGMTLAANVSTPVDMPPFANSQMDGFAVIAADTVGASDENPVRLDVCGEIAAGTDVLVEVRPGTSHKIFTGALMPQGADAVIPVEDTATGPESGGWVDIAAAATAGQFVRPAGEDYRKGDVALERGALVTPAVIALAGGIGLAKLNVHRRPRVCVISTGDELVAPGLPLGRGQIYDSNGYALAAQVEEAGAECTRRLHAADTVESLTGAMAEAESSLADVVITCGGVSVGDHDLVRPVFASRGEIDFWRVAIRPGKPFAFGRLGDTLFFGLPGNPASAMVTFELFVRPALLRMMGRASVCRPIVTATLRHSVSHGPGRRSFVRAVLSRDNSGALQVEPAGKQGSHLFRSLVVANSLLIVPEDVESLAEGATAEVMLTQDPIPPAHFRPTPALRATPLDAEVG